MADSRLTEERLRGWLDSNQVQRERLCAQLLPILGPYSHVEPRRPKGGPDGARDLQAVFNDQFVIWAGVGFRNSAKDDKEDKAWVKKKFTDDLCAAMEENKSLQGFVFLTNIDLTPREQDELKDLAIAKRLGHVAVFIRERLRLALDSVEGWGYRLQFLEIEMTREEQLTFIDRFGVRLENLLERQRAELAERQLDIEAKLRRIEFLHDCGKPVRGASFIVVLDKPYTPAELGHFRILLRARNFYERDPHPTLWLGARDAYATVHAANNRMVLFGVKTIAWSCSPDESIQSTVTGGGQLDGSQIDAWAHMYRRGPFKTLGDFDRLAINVFVTKPLAPLIQCVALVVNDYQLMAVEATHLATLVEILGPQYGYLGPVEWMEELSPEERTVEWEELRVKGPDAGVPIDADHPPFGYHRAESWDTHFEEYTPLKFPPPEDQERIPG